MSEATGNVTRARVKPSAPLAALSRSRAARPPFLPFLRTCACLLIALVFVACAPDSPAGTPACALHASLVLVWCIPPHAVVPELPCPVCCPLQHPPKHPSVPYQNVASLSLKRQGGHILQLKVLCTHCIIPPDPPTPTCSRTDPFSCVAQVLFDVFILLAAGEWGSDRHVYAPAPCHIMSYRCPQPPPTSPIIALGAGDITAAADEESDGAKVGIDEYI